MLIANGVRLSVSNPMRQLAAPLAGSVERAAWHGAGSRRSSFTALNAESGYPDGVRHPASWCMAPVAGGLASRYEVEADFTLGSLNLAEGRNVEGSTSATFTLGDAQLELVVSASGAVTFTFTTDGNLAGSLAAVGDTTVTFTVGTATLGAIIDALGATTATFTPGGTSTAIGVLAGDITPFTELSPQSLADAVWGAIIESGLSAEEVIRIILATTSNDGTGLESGAPTFKSVDGSKNRIEATYSGGVRTVTARDGT